MTAEHRDDQTLAAELRGVSRHYPGRGLRQRETVVRAVDGVSLGISPGQTVGLVGESGSGKSTVARLLLRLIAPTAGRVVLGGVDITHAGGAQLRSTRRHMQMVFQDPHSSFDPMASVGHSVEEALRAHGRVSRAERRARVAELFDEVELSRTLMHRRPLELSGGQLQRAAIARALALRPSLIALDEPLSSLDMSTQAQIVNLLKDLQEELRPAYLFISHDLSIVEHLSHVTAVMYLGRIVELGPTATLHHTPKHPYTEALLSASPIAHPARQRSRTRIILNGEIPSPSNPPSGCRFRTRCPQAMDICARTDPPGTVTDDGTIVYCHLHLGGERPDHEGVADLDDSRGDAPRGRAAP